MFYELDNDGNFVGDLIEITDQIKNWTKVVMPQPVFRPMFKGQRLETGEWVGQWTDLGPEPERPPAPEIAVEVLTQAVQSYLDSTARAYGYNSILSLCTYATSKNERFANEGQAGVEWRDSVWGFCYQMLGEVQAGVIPWPTKSELIKQLPKLNWPQ